MTYVKYFVHVCCDTSLKYIIISELNGKHGTWIVELMNYTGGSLIILQGRILTMVCLTFRHKEMLR